MTHALADELAHFAETERCPHLAPIIARLRRPVEVAVLGRNGVGGSTVAAALRQWGVVVLPDGVGAEASDVRVLVIAEAVKPEDQRALTSSSQPTVIVLTKADLAGSGPGGPMAAARRRAAAIQLTTGLPTVPMIGLLAALDGPEALDDGLVDTLRSFVTEPADLTSVDAFLDGPHPVGRDVRARLVERLDRFGIAHAVLGLADGCEPGELITRLRDLGNLDEVMSALEVAAAQVKYLRICAARSELRALAVRFDDDRMAALVAANNTALAAMTAAVEVVEATGLAVDRRDTRPAHLGRAIHWHRYGRGPVNALHRRCSDDIVKGSLVLVTEQST